MKKTLIFAALSLVLILSGFGVVGVASAASFPAGCSSGLGYSVTNGAPCSGTSTVKTGVAGCDTALGYSVTNGDPCSGGSSAIFFLNGCTSVQGYSTIDGHACNGTTVATPVTGGVSTGGTPGFPTTGGSGSPILNMILLLTSGALALVGSTYLVRYYRKA